MKKIILIFVYIFLINLSIFSALALSATVHVSEKYTEVLAGERLYFKAEIRYPENLQKKNLELTYKIITKEGEVIAQSDTLKVVHKGASFVDFITVPENSKEGTYAINIEVRDKYLSGEAQANFYVIEYKIIHIEKYFIIFVPALLIITIFIILRLLLKKNKKLI